MRAWPEVLILGGGTGQGIISRHRNAQLGTATSIEFRRKSRWQFLFLGFEGTLRDSAIANNFSLCGLFEVSNARINYTCNVVVSLNKGTPI